MVLPVILDHYADETAIDFVARLAAANGFASLRSFLGHTDVTAKAIVQGEADALSMVSDWSGVAVSCLKTLAVVGSGAGGNWQMGRATLSKDMRPGRTHRFCACCILEDRRMMSGRLVSRAYRRAWWSVRGIEGCHVHDCALLEVSVDSEDDIHDFPRFVRDNIAHIEGVAAAPLPRRQPALDRYLRERVFKDGGASFLDALDVHVAAEFSRYLGDFLVLHDIRDQMPEGRSVNEWGFLLASKGEPAIRALISDVIKQNPPNKRRVETVLGPMTRWLRRNLSKAVYVPIADLIQDILERNMPFGPGETIFKPVEVRHLYCVNTAHADFGMHKDRIKALIQENIPGFQHDLPTSQAYFDATLGAQILRAASETLTSKEAAVVLGLTEARMDDVLKLNIIECVEKRSDDTRPYTRIREADLRGFERKFGANMTAVQTHDGTISIVEACQAWHLSFQHVASMIFSGTVRSYLQQGDEPFFSRIRVDHDGFKPDVSPMAGGDEHWMRTKEVERVLGTTTATVSLLIELGYLHVRSARRETGKTVKLVERQSVLDFERYYVSLSQIARSRQGYRATIKNELDLAGIAPIFEPTGFIARFYRKSDLSQIG
ncbi:TniQ family protein [Agrobacterium bohemicum]|uniref:TniQ domain-containing protein n=1 Tax=Agrobacterium bohemicum TaxID=2052828 RepID=A0A135P818_9HYPH|nr:TniQ family protein [Agrobacterium bohemicum]KXG87572.1 hypothetical protein ATO67_18150 [Agrobacterium bohemicum]